MELPSFYTPSELLLSLVWSNIKRVYSFWDFVCDLVTLPFKTSKAYSFLQTIYIRLCWQNDHKHQECILVMKKTISLLCLYLLRPTWSEHHPQLFVLVFFHYYNYEQDSLCTFMKSTKISSKSDILPFISQSGVMKCWILSC